MHNLCIPLTALGHLICFQFLTMTNRAVMIVHVQVSVWTCVFMSLDWGARTRIVESYGESVFKVVNGPRVLGDGDAILCFLQQHRECPLLCVLAPPFVLFNVRRLSEYVQASHGGSHFFLLMTGAVEPFSVCYWPFTSLLLWSFCPNLLPV